MQLLSIHLLLLTSASLVSAGLCCANIDIRTCDWVCGPDCNYPYIPTIHGLVDYS